MIVCAEDGWVDIWSNDNAPEEWNHTAFMKYQKIKIYCLAKDGKVLYIGDTASSRKEGGKLMVLESEYLASLGLPPMSHDKLPDIVVLMKKENGYF